MRARGARGREVRRRGRRGRGRRGNGRRGNGRRGNGRRAWTRRPRSSSSPSSAAAGQIRGAIPWGRGGSTRLSAVSPASGGVFATDPTAVDERSAGRRRRRRGAVDQVRRLPRLRGRERRAVPTTGRTRRPVRRWSTARSLRGFAGLRREPSGCQHVENGGDDAAEATFDLSRTSRRSVRPRGSPGIRSRPLVALFEGAVGPAAGFDRSSRGRGRVRRRAAPRGDRRGPGR